MDQRGTFIRAKDVASACAGAGTPGNEEGRTEAELSRASIWYRDRRQDNKGQRRAGPGRLRGWGRGQACRRLQRPHRLSVPMMLCSARTSCRLSGMLSSYRTNACGSKEGGGRTGSAEQFEGEPAVKYQRTWHAACRSIAPPASQQRSAACLLKELVGGHIQARFLCAERSGGSKDGDVRRWGNGSGAL